jgi:CheY-like chemotaxis protein
MVQPSNYRILVAEDQITNRKLVVRLLTKLGFQVQEALNGQDAVALWQQWCPHLILMDMRMPVMNGYEAARQIRQQERSNRLDAAGKLAEPTAIIALTASAFEEDRSEIFEAGCDGYLPKPFKVEQFLATIVQHLSLQSMPASDFRNDFQNDFPNSAIALSMPDPSWPQISRQLTADDLAELPNLWCAELHQAAAQLDAERCVELIQTVADSHLIDPLMHLVEEFRFDLLLDLTQR